MSRLIRIFAAMRMAIGVGSWLTPGLSARTFGLDVPGQPLITQLFGARDLALGLALQQAPPGPARVQALRMGVFCDVLDAVAVLRNARRKAVSPAAIVLVGVGAASFATIGVLALRQQAAAESVEPIDY